MTPGFNPWSGVRFPTATRIRSQAVGGGHVGFAFPTLTSVIAILTEDKLMANY